MKPRKPRVFNKEKGQALVEFALITIFFFTLIVGIADFARLYFTYSSVSNAAREGARYGVINPYDTEGIINRAESLLVVFGTDPKIEISYPDGSRAVGARIRVKVSCDFQLLMVPVPPFELVADSTMRIETVP